MRCEPQAVLPAPSGSHLFSANVRDSMLPDDCA